MDDSPRNLIRGMTHAPETPETPMSPIRPFQLAIEQASLDPETNTKTINRLVSTPHKKGSLLPNPLSRPLVTPEAEPTPTSRGTTVIPMPQSTVLVSHGLFLFLLLVVMVLAAAIDVLARPPASSSSLGGSVLARLLDLVLLPANQYCKSMVGATIPQDEAFSG